MCVRESVRASERDSVRASHACYGFSAVSERESVRYVRECAMAASHRRQEYRVEKKGTPAILASALTLLWPPQYRSLTRCACSCVGAAEFSTAIVALALRSRGWRAAAVGAAAAAGDARRRREGGGGEALCGAAVAAAGRQWPCLLESTHTHITSARARSP